MTDDLSHSAHLRHLRFMTVAIGYSCARSRSEETLAASKSAMARHWLMKVIQ
jgi:hypothetical protein